MDTIFLASAEVLEWNRYDISINANSVSEAIAIATEEGLESVSPYDREHGMEGWDGSDVTGLAKDITAKHYKGNAYSVSGLILEWNTYTFNVTAPTREQAISLIESEGAVSFDDADVDVGTNGEYDTPEKGQIILTCDMNKFAMQKRDTLISKLENKLNEQFSDHCDAEVGRSDKDLYADMYIALRNNPKTNEKETLRATVSFNLNTQQTTFRLTLISESTTENTVPVYKTLVECKPASTNLTKICYEKISKAKLLFDTQGYCSRLTSFLDDLKRTDQAAFYMNY
jgi:hypothetical protein